MRPPGRARRRGRGRSHPPRPLLRLTTASPNRVLVGEVCGAQPPNAPKRGSPALRLCFAVAANGCDNGAPEAGPSCRSSSGEGMPFPKPHPRGQSYLHNNRSGCDKRNTSRRVPPSLKTGQVRKSLFACEWRASPKSTAARGTPPRGAPLSQPFAATAKHNRSAGEPRFGAFGGLCSAHLPDEHTIRQSCS